MDIVYLCHINVEEEDLFQEAFVPPGESVVLLQLTLDGLVAQAAVE